MEATSVGRRDRRVRELSYEPLRVASVHGDELWEENAAFIAAAREAMPELVAEVRRLRALLVEQVNG